MPCQLLEIVLFALDDSKLIDPITKLFHNASESDPNSTARGESHDASNMPLSALLNSLLLSCGAIIW